MPTYLVHGFRWQRANIRVFVILRNLDDASPDWIVRPASACSLLDTFQASFGFLPPRVTAASTLTSSALSSSASSASSLSASSAAPPSAAPSSASSLSAASASAAATTSSILASQAGYPVRLLEEYDPADLETVATPYAYVADHVVPVDRSVSIVDEMAAYERLKQAAAPWLGRLRDQLQPGEDVRWYVVVNGDEQRGWPHDAPSAAAKPPPLQREAQWPLVQPLSEEETDKDNGHGSNHRDSALRRLRFELGGFGFEHGGLGDERDQLPVVTATATKVRAARAARQPERASARAPPPRLPRAQPRAGLPPPSLPPPTMPPPPPPANAAGQRRRTDTAESGPSRPQSSGGFHRLLRTRSRSDARQLLQQQQQEQQLLLQQYPQLPQQPQQQQQHPQLPHQQQHYQQLLQLPLQPLPSAPPNLPLPPIPTSAQPAVRHKKSTDVGALRPKTATGRSGGSSGFRRLFGRSSKVEDKAAEA